MKVAECHGVGIVLEKPDQAKENLKCSVWLLGKGMKSKFPIKPSEWERTSFLSFSEEESNGCEKRGTY
jgi:hypothetical protein